MNTKLLRQKILDLAIRGKLTEQKKSDGTTRDLLKQIASNVILSNAKNPAETAKSSRVILSKRSASKDLAKEIIPLDKSEAPFEIPENWEWVNAEDLFNIRSAIRIHQTDWKDDGIPFFRGRELVQLCKTGNVNFDIYISPELYEENKKKGGVPQKDDILVSAVGTLGFAYVVKGDKPFYYKDAYILCFENRNNLNPYYFQYLIHSQFINKIIYEGSKGTTVDQLTIENAKKLPFPVPPLAEQQRIVTAIENAFAEITEIENNQELLKKHIKQGRQKILDLAIRGKLTQQLKTDGTTKDLLESIMAASSECHPERSAAKSKDPAKKKQTAEPKQIIPLDKTTALFEIPESWEWVKLGDIGDWQSGTTPSKSNSAYYENGTIPWLNTGDLNDGLVTNIPKMVTETALKETSLRINAADSVCIAMYGATIGKLGILSVPATTNQACCVCNNLKVGIEKMWLFYFLMNHKQEFIEAGFGGAQPNISKEKIVSTPMPLPPLAEQQRIVVTIEQAFAEFDAMEVNL